MDFKKFGKSPIMMSAMVKMLAEMVADDPNAPEALHVSSKIVLADQKLKETISKAAGHFVAKLGPDDTEEDIQRGKEFLAYLECVIAGFDNFLSQYKGK